VPGEGKALREKWIDSGSESGMTQNCHAELVSASSNRGSLPKCHCEERSDEAIQETKFSVGKINTKTELLTFGLPRFARNDKRAAFTLAEVLITLAIIGVVAAMTIPTLVQSYKKQVIETKLTRFYTTMNQAIRLSEAHNGSVTTWENEHFKGRANIGCNKDATNEAAYCTKVIQLNNWKIPKDYPFKF